MFHSWKPLVAYFKKHKSDSKRCENLFDALTSCTFIRVAYMMMDVIPSLTALNLVFQKQDLDIAAVQPAIDGFFSAVDGASTGKSYYQRELKSLLKKCDGNTVKLKDVKLDLDHKTVAELDKAFGNDVRKPFLDTLKSEMSCRFPKENTSVATSFQVLGLRSLSFLSPNEREDYGLEGLNILLNHFAVNQDSSDMTPVVSKALVS